ncbi:hypothetical protein CGLO_06672 [Colletotrichum gloeosporioides Cg-14]|uniref:Uncharacterized protein n=1 Tax=Colletotrichum gloeosporioides (strain Cg-14) TaxID=1237896 RepID=T0KLL2_COLGC|nr:hypothetical protein CGLO_06672 [Colletotrichum gloeosporioides Cg-14]
MLGASHSSTTSNYWNRVSGLALANFAAAYYHGTFDFNRNHQAMCIWWICFGDDWDDPELDNNEDEWWPWSLFWHQTSMQYAAQRQLEWDSDNDGHHGHHGDTNESDDDHDDDDNDDDDDDDDHDDDDSDSDDSD